LHAQLKSANTFFIQHSLYLEENEQKIINKYIEALLRLRSAVFTSGDDDIVHAWMKTWIQIPPNLEAEIESAAKEVATLRTEIKSRVTKVIAKS
jgi:hypothetical protein